MWWYWSATRARARVPEGWPRRWRYAEATAAALSQVLVELGARVAPPLAVPESRLAEASRLVAEWVGRHASAIADLAAAEVPDASRPR